MIVNTATGTRIDEIAVRIYRISTPVPPSASAGGFSFNQYLVDDDAPLLFHTGMRSLFAPVCEAIETVVPVARLRYIGLSHVEADECGALDAFLAAAPQAEAVCSQVGAAISLGDLAARPARGLADGEVLALGHHDIEWLTAPHVPHNWETGYLHDRTTGTFFCGDLFVQGGHELPPLTSSDILEPAEAFRRAEPGMGLPPSWSLAPGTREVLERFAALRPTTLACMHGSAWQGPGAVAAGMLHGFADRLVGRRVRTPALAA
jgi:glyoxylase-like metal-dependent hydrolase (beta-lactamase superfamily II)